MMQMSQNCLDRNGRFDIDLTLNGDLGRIDLKVVCDMRSSDGAYVCSFIECIANNSKCPWHLEHGGRQIKQNGMDNFHENKAFLHQVHVK